MLSPISMLIHAKIVAVQDVSKDIKPQEWKTLLLWKFYQTANFQGHFENLVTMWATILTHIGYNSPTNIIDPYVITNTW